MSVIKSDTAVIVLNFYPPEIVKRAVESVARQDYQGSVTVYLGFHDRCKEHQEEVRRLLADYPVEYIEIDRDLVSDTRAKNVILRYALENGSHKYLFFLDDDDEWRPEYLREMTSRCDGFVTCGKEILNDDTGEITVVTNDVDYEGMGFLFDLWKGRELPWFVKQVCDKYILREFSTMFPHHEHINRPLYRLHQRQTSLTYTLALGRKEAEQDQPLGPTAVILPENDTGSALYTIAQAGNFTAVREDDDLTAFGAVIASSSCRLISDKKAGRFLRIACMERVSQLSDCRRADAVLTCDPLWASLFPDDTELIPVGVPCLVSDEQVMKNIKEKNAPERTFFISGAKDQAAADRVRRYIPSDWRESDSLCGAAVCIDVTEQGKSRCPGIVEAYASGTPCVSYPFSAAHRILFVTSGLAINSPEEIANVLDAFDAEYQRCLMTDSLKLYSRCYGSFFWNNFTRRYTEAAAKRIKKGDHSC